MRKHAYIDGPRGSRAVATVTDTTVVGEVVEVDGTSGRALVQIPVGGDENLVWCTIQPGVYAARSLVRVQLATDGRPLTTIAPDSLPVDAEPVGAGATGRTVVAAAEQATVAVEAVHEVSVLSEEAAAVATQAQQDLAEAQDHIENVVVPGIEDARDRADAAAAEGVQAKADALAAHNEAMHAQSTASSALTAAGDAQSAAAAATVAASQAQQAADAADAQALAALGAANTAQATAGSKGEIIRQESAPTGSRANPANLWIKTSTGQPYTYVGGTWTLVTDTRITAAANAADAAQNAAVNAQAQADTASQAAAAAQTTANTAVSNAAAANSEALAAKSSAASAQSTADSAYANAATAQGAADVAAAQAAQALANAAELIVNGGFETGDLTGWTSSGDAQCLTNATDQYGIPRSGTHHARLGVASISQTITGLTTGQLLRVELWKYCIANERTLTLSIQFDGHEPQLLASHSSASASHVRMLQNVSVPAGASSAIVTVACDTVYIRLDDVSVRDVTAAVAAEQAAAAAQTTANTAVSNAATAQSAANAAAASAAGAQAAADAAGNLASTADGRYTVAAANPTAANASGKPLGAVWEVRSGGVALRRFVLTAASTWTQVKIGQDFVGENAIGQAQIGDAAVGTAQIGDATITNAKIGDMAVDKLRVTGGAQFPTAVVDTLVGQDAFVQNLWASKAVIADQTNLWPNQRFDPLGPVIGTPSAEVPPVGNARQCASRDHRNTSASFEVAPGEQYVIEVTAKRTAGARALRGGLSYTEQSSGNPWDSLGDFLEVETVDGEWKRFRRDVTVLPGKHKATFYIQINQDAATGFDTVWQVADATVRRKTGSVLIENGAITAEHITATEALWTAMLAVAGDATIGGELLAETILGKSIYGAYLEGGEMVVRGAENPDPAATHSGTFAAFNAASELNDWGGYRIHATTHSWDSSGGQSGGCLRAVSGTYSLPGSGSYTARAGALAPKLITLLTWDLAACPYDGIQTITAWVKTQVADEITMRVSSFVNPEGAALAVSSVVTTVANTWTKVEVSGPPGYRFDNGSANAALSFEGKTVFDVAASATRTMWVDSITWKNVPSSSSMVHIYKSLTGAPTIDVTDWQGLKRIQIEAPMDGDAAITFLGDNNEEYRLTKDGLSSGAAAAAWGEVIAGTQRPVLIDAGAVTVTPSAANTTMAVPVTFTAPFTATPRITVTPNTSVPEAVTVAMSGASATGFTVRGRRTSTTAFSVNWIAVQVL